MQREDPPEKMEVRNPGTGRGRILGPLKRQGRREGGNGREEELLRKQHRNKTNKQKFFFRMMRKIRPFLKCGYSGLPDSPEISVAIH